MCIVTVPMDAQTLAHIIVTIADGKGTVKSQS
jgi:hypothetical protein